MIFSLLIIRPILAGPVLFVLVQVLRPVPFGPHDELLAEWDYLSHLGPSIAGVRQHHVVSFLQEQSNLRMPSNLIFLSNSRNKVLRHGAEWRHIQS
jgi:hypothetical protein